MKYKTTVKAIKEGCCNIVYIGYCDAWYLLSNHSANAYTCGVYGWNFDVYEVYDVTICTGYRGMPGRRASNVNEYEKKARAIFDNYSIKYEERKEQIEKLLEEFCKQA